MIERLQQGTRHAVSVMQEGQKQAAVSVAQSENAAAALTSITEAVLRISDMSSQIASAAEQQSAATDEINHTVIQIDHASQSTHEATALAEQTSSELHQRAEDMLTQTARFRV